MIMVILPYLSKIGWFDKHGLQHCCSYLSPRITFSLSWSLNSFDIYLPCMNHRTQDWSQSLQLRSCQKVHMWPMCHLMPSHRSCSHVLDQTCKIHCLPGRLVLLGNSLHHFRKWCSWQMPGLEMVTASLYHHGTLEASGRQRPLISALQVKKHQIPHQNIF